MKKTLYLFCVFILLFPMVKGQEIANVDFEVNGTEIIVRYDLLNCPKHYTYDLQLEVEIVNQDGRTQKIKPKTVTGDLSRQECGREKIVRWQVVEDQGNLMGDMTIFVRVIEGHYFKPKNRVTENKNHQNLAGPEAALYSIIVPGLGDQMVSHSKRGKIAGWGVALAYSYFVGNAFRGFISYTADYDLYKNSTDQYWMDYYYEKANNTYHKTVQNFYYAGIILGVDVVYVLLKGVYNEQVLKKSYAGAVKFERRVSLATNGTIGLKYIYSF